MAKVTITFEDAEKEGNPTVRIAIAYQDQDPDKVTAAEAMANEVMEAFEMVEAIQNKKEPLKLVPSSDPNENLN